MYIFPKMNKEGLMQNMPRFRFFDVYFNKHSWTLFLQANFTCASSHAAESALTTFSQKLRLVTDFFFFFLCLYIDG